MISWNFKAFTNSPFGESNGCSISSKSTDITSEEEEVYNRRTALVALVICFLEPETQIIPENLRPPKTQ